MILPDDDGILFTVIPLNEHSSDEVAEHFLGEPENNSRVDNDAGVGFRVSVKQVACK